MAARRPDCYGETPWRAGDGAMTRTSDRFESLRSSLRLEPSGRLILGGQEMILLPRHFLRYILREMKAAAGAAAFDEAFRTAGRDGAMEFCRRHRQAEGVSPRQAVEDYLIQVGLRGWGAFSLDRLDAECVEIGVRGSALVSEGDLPDGHAMWEGVAEGVLMVLREAGGMDSAGRVSVRSEGDGDEVRIEAVWTTDGG